MFRSVVLARGRRRPMAPRASERRTLDVDDERQLSCCKPRRNERQKLRRSGLHLSVESARTRECKREKPLLGNPRCTAANDHRTLAPTPLRRRQSVRELTRPARSRKQMTTKTNQSKCCCPPASDLHTHTHLQENANKIIQHGPSPPLQWPHAHHQNQTHTRW
jgi:hypothetical protein